MREIISKIELTSLLGSPHSASVSRLLRPQRDGMCICRFNGIYLCRHSRVDHARLLHSPTALTYPLLPLEGIWAAAPLQESGLRLPTLVPCSLQIEKWETDGRRDRDDKREERATRKWAAPPTIGATLSTNQEVGNRWEERGKGFSLMWCFHPGLKARVNDCCRTSF